MHKNKRWLFFFILIHRTDYPTQTYILSKLKDAHTLQHVFVCLFVNELPICGLCRGDGCMLCKCLHQPRVQINGVHVAWHPDHLPARPYFGITTTPVYITMADEMHESAIARSAAVAAAAI